MILESDGDTVRRGVRIARITAHPRALWIGLRAKWIRNDENAVKDSPPEGAAGREREIHIRRLQFERGHFGGRS